jgi:hypothetical protein
MTRTLREPNFAVLLAAAWLFSFAIAASSWTQSAPHFVDGDDALRMVQVRDFLAGRGWFDLHEPRLGPLGYDSHWSRLIDAGIAGLISFFQLFVNGDLAESLVLLVWPQLWLLPTMAGAAAIAWRVGGREAAIVALLLCVFGLPGFPQFGPGRIDHHNVQIALAVLTVAAALWSDRLRFAAAAAGVLSGLALAIGFEGLPFLALVGAAFGLRYVADPGAAPALRAYGLSIAASAGAALVVSVPFDHWGRMLCDQIALNYVAPTVIAGLGFAVAGHLCAGRAALRLAAVAAVGLAAAALFVLLEPRCVAGPYGQVDPAVVPMLITAVTEMQSLPGLLRKDFTTGVTVAAFPAAALLAIMLLLREPRHRDFAALVACAACVLGCAIGFMALRGYPYALWFGVPLVAVAAVDLFHRFRLTGLIPRFLAAMVVTPTAISVAAMSIAAAASGSGLPEERNSGRAACVSKDSYAALAALPKGLVVANELEWGSYILVWTPHRVLAAPYHRLTDGIVLTHRIFALPPDAARAVVGRVGADYLVTCTSLGAAGLSDAERPASLWSRLDAGDVPGWLERLPARGAYTIYRVKR